MDPASLYDSPNALAPHYSRFGVSRAAPAHRPLAPGLARSRLRRPAAAWLDAARYVDDKWEHAFAQAERVREGFAAAAGRRGRRHRARRRTPTSWWCACSRRCRSGAPAAGHDRRRIPHASAASSIGWRRRASPSCGCPRRRSSRWPRGWRAPWTIARRWCWSRRSSSTPGASPAGSAEVAASCRRHGSRLLVDAYHALNVVPFSLADEGLGRRVRRRWRIQVLPARRGQLLPADPAGHRAPAGDHRMVQRVHRAGGAAARRAGRLWPGRRSVRGRDLRSHQPLSRRRRLRLLSRARPHAGAPARGEPASDRAARVGIRCARPRSGGVQPRPRAA